MTKFEDLELVYKEFINLSNEINDLIEQEDYTEANLKFPQSDKLLKKVINAKAATVLNDEEKDKINQLEQNIKESHSRRIDSLKERKVELEFELKKTNKQVKVSSAYDIQTNSNEGRLIDLSE